MAGGEQLLHQLECAQVRDMDDGAMGSLEFAGGGHRFLGSCLVEAGYLDRDGVPVSVALNSDANGLLYELDMNLLALRQRHGETAETTALTGTYHNLLRMWAET